MVHSPRATHPESVIYCGAAAFIVPSQGHQPIPVERRDVMGRPANSSCAWWRDETANQ